MPGPWAEQGQVCMTVAATIPESCDCSPVAVGTVCRIFGNLRYAGRRQVIVASTLQDFVGKLVQTTQIQMAGITCRS